MLEEVRAAVASYETVRRRTAGGQGGRRLVPFGTGPHHAPGRAYSSRAPCAPRAHRHLVIGTRTTTTAAAAAGAGVHAGTASAYAPAHRMLPARLGAPRRARPT